MYKFKALLPDPSSKSIEKWEVTNKHTHPQKYTEMLKAP